MLASITKLSVFKHVMRSADKIRYNILGLQVWVEYKIVCQTS